MIFGAKSSKTKGGVLNQGKENEHRDRQISKMMDQIEKEMPDFDSCKCPPVK